ncbi:phosphatase, partial [Streptomyces sp. SID8455]|nr:phosphatase [Streptomyces sp. SID8455]
MPSHLFADRPAPQPPAHDAVDALIHRTRRLRGDVDAVGRNTVTDEDGPQA